MAPAPASIPSASSARNVPRRASSAPEVIGREPAGAVEGGGTHERRSLFAASGRPNRTCQARRPTVKAAHTAASLASTLERMAIPEPNSGCLIWLGTLSGGKSGGYGCVSVNGKMRKAHRVAYELAIGPIPDELQLDHRCRLRCCVNTAHLEAVTNSVNVARGIGPTARNRVKTHCVRGHEFTPENVYHRPTGRECRACSIERSKKWRS